MEAKLSEFASVTPATTTTVEGSRSSVPSPSGRFARAAALALGLVLLIYLLAHLGGREILSMLLAIRWTLLPVLMLYGGHQALRAMALTLCVPRPGGLRYLDAVAVRLAGEAVQYLTFSGPVVAEPTKAWLLGRRGLTTWEGLAATLAEYLASSFAAAVMAVAGLGYVLSALHPRGAVRVAAIAVLVAMTTFALLCIIGIAMRLHIIGGIVRGATRLPLVRGRARPRAQGVRQAEDLLIHTLRDHPGRLVAVVATESAAQLCLGVELFCLLAVLQPPFTLGRAMLIEGATKFITAGYFFVPGQVGVAEGTYAVIFNAFAIPSAAGLAVSFVRRLRSIVTACLGLLAFSVLTRVQVEAPP